MNVWPLLILLVIEIGAGFLLALPRSKGCLPGLVRLTAFLLGAAAPVALFWRVPTGIAGWLIVVAGLILGAVAVALTGTGWLAVLRRDPGEAAEGVDISFLGVTTWLGDTNTAGSNRGDADNALSDLLLMVTMYALLAIFVVGLVIAGFIEKVLMPGVSTIGRRLTRLGLSLSYAALVCALLVFILQRWLGGGLAAPTDSGAIPLSNMGQDTVVNTTLDAQLLVEGRLRALDTTTGPYGWTLSYTVPLPLEWPPTNGTRWATYAYASRLDPDIGDGQRVAAPLARFDQSSAGPGVTVVTLRNRLEEIGIQGVAPLAGDQLAILRRGPELIPVLQAHTSLPNPADPLIKETKDFYRAWLATSGTIAAAVRPQHASFFAWFTD